MLHKTERPATVATVNGPDNRSKANSINRPITLSPAFTQVRAQARMLAWCRVLDAISEQRDALQQRIWREDPDDRMLDADVQTWCELAASLAAFLEARRGGAA